MFSLDAGANVHLLYPLRRLSIMDFIQELTSLQKGYYIEDQVGNGAKKFSLVLWNLDIGIW